jgi:uncharacterized protein (UPF0332 family)
VYEKQLLATAEAGARRGKRPSQADLRRAVSTAYYAMFHALSENCANSLLGVRTPDRCERAWSQTYRALDHKKAREACRQCSEAKFCFPADIKDFAAFFVTMNNHRNKADYDPRGSYSRKSAVELIEAARRAINALENAPAKHRKAFAAFVLFRLPSGDA